MTPVDEVAKGSDREEQAAVAGGARETPEAVYVTLPGCWGALIAGCLSFTPSLLPRDGIIQGLIWGITAAIGYGLGVLAAWIWRAFADRDARQPRRRSWTVFVIGAAVLGRARRARSPGSWSPAWSTW